VKITLKNTKAKIRVQGQLSREISIGRGLRQGDALSTTLFNLCLEAAIRRIEINPGGTINKRMVQYLVFADDVVIIGRSDICLKECTQQLDEGAQQLVLEINNDKTKYMINTRNKEIFGRIEIVEMESGKNFDRVQEFKYLGVVVTEDNIISEEIKARIASGNRGYFAFQKLMRSSNALRKLKDNNKTGGLIWRGNLDVNQKG
jgi:hypothetical protein